MPDQDRVDELVLEVLDSGLTPEEICRDCPELLPQVRTTWLRVRAVDAEFSSILPGSNGSRETLVPFDGTLPQIPGYEIERVLGRGGVAVVYLARHTRLGRWVAVKMLLSGQHARASEVDRFSREARTLAELDHPNIVQIFDVGDYNGCPYFTMEYLNGGTLSDRVKERPMPAKDTATMIATFADAIHVAHQSGIVHRDLTPSNILFTGDGIPKIADFGLARHLQDAGGLTLTGAALGTPGYMAPEQANRRGGEIGPAADVYALGAILYKLLTGRPPFQAETTALTIRQLLFDEPLAPSKLNPNVPRDLETICLKCLSKESPRRYASAAALAEDVRRFIRGEPIAARRAGPVERLARWARRRPAAAALLAVTLLVATAVLGGAGWLIEQWIVTARAVEADLREAERLQQHSAFPEAGAAMERARSRLGDGGPFWMYPVVETARHDHQFLVRLEAIRLNRSTLVRSQQAHNADLRFNKARADRDYVEAFRDQGLGEPPNDPEGVAARVRASKWATHIVAALDDWAVSAADPARQDWLLEVARRADPDPWRDRLRDPAVWRDGKALAELARAAPLAEQPVPLLLALGERLSASGEDGVGFLRRIREQYPEDFWATSALALALHDAGKRPGGNPLPALAYYRKALEIRPQAVAVLNDLGVVLLDRDWVWDNERDAGPGAITILHQVVRKDPQFAPGFNNLGMALQNKGDWGVAALMYQDALEIDPRLAPAHCNLGEIRAGSGAVNEAIDHYRQALLIDPDSARGHYLLGVALLAKGRFDDADDYYPEGVKPLGQFRGPALREAMDFSVYARDCDPRWTPARNTLHLPPQDEARLKEAIEHFRQAVRLEPQFAMAHGALGRALLARREITEAEAELRRGLDLFPKGEEKLRANLEGQMQRCQRLRALDGRLPAVVQGKDRPAAADGLDLAELCFVNKNYATAARLYDEALTATPQLTEDLRAGHRYNAARAAALAGGGCGDDVAGLGEPEREGLRKQARVWLRLDLAAWAKKVDTGTAADRIQAQKRLAPWRDDPDLAGLRDGGALERLPATERQECRSLWQELTALLRRAQTTR